MKTNSMSIAKQKKKLEEKRKEIEETQLNGLRELLTNEVVIKLCLDCGYLFRKRLLTPVAIVFHTIGAAISRDGSFQSAWHNAGQTGRADVLAKGRKRLPLKLWNRIFEWVCGQIDTEFESKNTWKGHRVIGIDGTCVSMSDNKKLEAAFGRANSTFEESRFPIARVVFAFSLTTLTCLRYSMGPYRTSESALLSSMMERFKRGDILVGDKGYAGANYYASYMQRGLEFITPAHHALNIDKLSIVKTLGRNDSLVTLSIGRSHRKKDPLLPRSISIRIIKISVKKRGKTSKFWIVTSLLDVKKYSADEIKNLYKKRWKVETFIEEIKLWLGADILRSKGANEIKKELCARIITFNLIRWLMLKAARKHNKTADKLSVSSALRLIASFSLKMGAAPFWKIIPLYAELLKKIASSEIPYRPDRMEPRAVRRNKKRYNRLKISREEWRKINGIAA